MSRCVLIYGPAIVLAVYATARFLGLNSNSGVVVFLIAQAASVGAYIYYIAHRIRGQHEHHNRRHDDHMRKHHTHE